jgi:hypothetical protein
MDTRKLLVGAVLAAALVTGVGGAVTASPSDDAPASCVGQHVSMMARMHGGTAAATAHHNRMHGTNMSVGEHQAHVRDEMCGR